MVRVCGEVTARGEGLPAVPGTRLLGSDSKYYDLEAENHRFIEWFGLEGTLKIA